MNRLNCLLGTDLEVFPQRLAGREMTVAKNKNGGHHDRRL